MRLIDVDELKADYGMADDCKDCKTGYRSCEYDRIYSKMDFCGWLDDAPTVDAVPVVRCKDCKHWQDYNGDHFVLQNCSRNNHVMKHGNDYCSWAERKDSDGNG